MKCCDDSHAAIWTGAIRNVNSLLILISVVSIACVLRLKIKHGKPPHPHLVTTTTKLMALTEGDVCFVSWSGVNHQAAGSQRLQET